MIASEDINGMAMLLLKEERCSRMALLESFFQEEVFSFLTWLCSYSSAFQLSLLNLLPGNMQGIPYIHGYDDLCDDLCNDNHKVYLTYMVMMACVMMMVLMTITGWGQTRCGVEWFLPSRDLDTECFW